jgi:hypothetical protein
MTFLLAFLLLAQAPPAKELPGEIPAAASIHSRKHPAPHLKVVEGQLVSPTGNVSADDVVDEMVDEFAADIARLGAAQVGPILIQRVRVSDNMNPAYAGVLESRLAAAVFRATNVALVRCVECNATRGRVDNGEWVVSRGVTTREQAQSLARKYGARTFLDVALALNERPSSVSMDVEMVRTEDSSIAFAEMYRMDADHALLYRGADKAQSREERLKDLEDRLNQRPRWAQAVEFGVMMVGADPGGAAWGAIGRFQLTEKFGDDHRFQAGVSLAGFLNPNTIGGAIVSAVWLARLSENSIFNSQLFFNLNAGAFITGNPGNTPIVGGGLRWLVGSRVALHGNLDYMVPVQFKGKKDTYGGISPELGVGFVWN